MKVMVAIDGSELAYEAAKRSRSLLAQASEVLVVAVVDEVPLLETSGVVGDGVGITTPVVVDEQMHAVEELEKYLGEEAKRVVELFPGAKALVERGAPGQTLCDVAAEQQVDVLVIGSHGRGAFKRMFVGSVSEHVIRHAPCPVLVIRAALVEHPDADAGSESQES